MDCADGIWIGQHVIFGSLFLGSLKVLRQERVALERLRVVDILLLPYRVSQATRQGHGDDVEAALGVDDRRLLALRALFAFKRFREVEVIWQLSGEHVGEVAGFLYLQVL